MRPLKIITFLLLINVFVGVVWCTPRVDLIDRIIWW